jgi:hypothetical protein
MMMALLLAADMEKAPYTATPRALCEGVAGNISKNGERFLERGWFRV